jgi:hypothetical protein
MNIFESLATLLDSSVSNLVSPVYALPLDIFRILFGFVSFFYFLHIYHQRHSFSNPDGLIDHKFFYSLFPYTRISLFQLWMKPIFFQVIFLVACFASLLLVLGIQVKMVTIFLFLITVSTYRWNFIIAGIDDAIMLISSFWIVLLPLGDTLVVTDWLVNPSVSLELWQTMTVSGATIRLFLINLAIIYITAGLWKWTSPMWRSGIAVYVSQKIAFSRFGHHLNSNHLPLLKIANYFVLVCEPLFPLMFILPTNSPIKWLFLISIIGFHMGIIITLKVPFANLVMLGGTVLAFRDEIMQFILGELPPTSNLQPIGQLGFIELLATFLVTCIILMNLIDIAITLKIALSNPKDAVRIAGSYSNPMYAILWAIGIAQSYHLFDGIDEGNYHTTYEVLEVSDENASYRTLPQTFFASSMRDSLLQSYLHGNFWLKQTGINESQRRGQRQTIYTRHVHRYCKENQVQGTIEVYATSQWITPDNLNLEEGVRWLMIRFSCQDGLPLIEYCQPNPPLYVDD